MSDEELEKKAADYAKFTSAWLDEALAAGEKFKDMFEHNSIGELKYVTALHLMVEEYCAFMGLPVEMFPHFAPAMLSIWYENGQPDKFEMKGFAVSVRKQKEGMPN